MKAILVVEMPKNCGPCPISNDWFVDGESKGFCPVTNEDCNFVERPEWCPLKPIVFCEECKYADKLGDWSDYDFSCRHFNTHSINKGNFCSYGEKKDESIDCN